MARRRKKKNNSRKIWFVLILLCAVSLLGWKIWTSDEVQMRFVYMWPSLSRRDFGIQREKQD